MLAVLVSLAALGAFGFFGRRYLKARNKAPDRHRMMDTPGMTDACSYNAPISTPGVTHNTGALDRARAANAAPPGGPHI